MFVCTVCEIQVIRWQGQCHQCKSWNTFQKALLPPSAPEKKGRTVGGYTGIMDASPMKATDLLSVSAPVRLYTHSSELNAVLGGGIVPGSVILIGGSPGAGKSTLLLQVAAHLAKSHAVLYVSGEESLVQIALHLDRLQLRTAQFTLLNETLVSKVCEISLRLRPKLLIVDSVQVLFHEEAPGPPGSISQVRESAAKLTSLAKKTGIAVILVGHVTKDGALAGPKALEHCVDTSLLLEAPVGSPYRTLRSKKNRFGTVHSLGIFAMTSEGMKEVKSPSSIFLSAHNNQVPGSAITVLWEGNRALLIEIQALIDTSVRGGSSACLSVGLENSRLALILAILNRHTALQFGQGDVFLNVVGGLKLDDTGADLAVAAALASSFLGRPLPPKTILFGELGLAGEIRPVPNGQARILEAQKHGFERIIFPKANEAGLRLKDASVCLQPVSKLSEAIEGLQVE